MELFRRTVGLKSIVYDSSIEALRKLIEDIGVEIVNISPRGYKMANGVDYCSVALKSKDRGHYSLQAYGQEGDKTTRASVDDGTDTNYSRIKIIED